MKKLVLSLAMVAALASCSTDEIVEVSRQAITFDETFVDNATRAAIDGSYITSTLEAFEVYGTISNTNGTANIFNKEKVVKGNSLGQGVNWSYKEANTQYWIPNNTYNFRAIAEGNVENVTEVTTDANNLATGVNLLDASAQKDILFAEDMGVTYISGSKTISFTFAHILSKVKFTFKNTISTNNGYGYKVTNVKINGTAKNGVYTIGASEPWSAAATPATYNLEFGNVTAENTAGAAATELVYNSSLETNWERLLIPSNEARNITFTAELYKDNLLIDTKNRTINTAAIELLPGQAYNFVVSLGNPGEPIQFDVTEVTDWVDQPETTAGGF